jgi:hypothetical protein
MAQFDTKLFLELSGKGGGPVQALGTAFGMPSCLVNLTAEALALLPTSVLSSIRGSTGNGAARADDVIKAAFSKLRFLHGIIEYDTEDGMFRFVSDSSSGGNDRDEGGILGAIGGFVGALGAAAGFAGRLYNNYNTTLAQIESIKDCISSYNDYLTYNGAAGADERMRLAGISPERYRTLVENNFGVDKDELQDALSFKLRALELQRKIEEEIANRLRNPSREPVFTSDYIDIVSGTLLEVEQLPPPEPIERIFRLEFGPPVARSGKFVLSVDGLYYDSQTSGIVPALLELETRRSKIELDRSWSLEYDPNLGGRGRPTTLEYFKSYVETILDPNLIDDSNFLQAYYLQDAFLQDLIGQKNRRVYDVSAQIAEASNQGASQVLIANLRQVMLSETAYYLTKINKRKKQIELAIKMPSMYGRGTLYTPGNVPINDFSYLEGINFQVDLDRQKTLILDQADVSGVVLPLVVKFTEQIDTSDSVVLDHLILNNIALGSVVADGTLLSAPQLGYNTNIVSDGLVALYNMLSFGFSEASSTTNSVFNSSPLGSRLNAQLVAGDPSSVFDRGVGLAYLHAITKHCSTSPSSVSSLGT